MKKFIIASYIILFFILNCCPLFLNKADAELPTFGGDDLYKYYVLDRIDAADSPDYVKKFAYENDCFKIMKHYYWSDELFKNKGGVYSCIKDKKVQYIYDYDNKLRFAKWYEKRKFKKPVFEF